MKMKTFILLVFSLFFIQHAFSQNADAFSKKQARASLKFAASRYQKMATELPANRLPRTLNGEGELVTSGSGWWCSGFYPGSLWYLYQFTGSEFFKIEALNRMSLVEKEKWNTGTHDLGFMIHCSYGNAYRLTGEQNFKNIILTASNSLITRYNENVGCIKSWDWPEQWEFPVIIDNMMNLEMLFWASKITNDPKYRNIALRHARTTMKNHFREDNSSWHVIDYDPLSGEVLDRDTAQGHSDQSAWSRGQAWGLYGYTMTYRETGKKEFLKQAEGIAEFILNHENLPEDMIPYWDFNAPEIPDAKRDASSAAIMASALLELSTFSEEPANQRYFSAAEKILNSLSSKKYRFQEDEDGYFILKHSVGSLPGNSEVDVPLTYADYYYIEALMRYIRLK